MAYEGPHPFPVANGGTDNSSFTAYSVICGGTTSTGALQNVSGVGTSGQVLTSNGSSALPTWQAAGGGSGGATAWAYFTTDGSGNATVVNSYNVSSVVWDGTSTYVVTLASAYANTHYVVVSGIAVPFSGPTSYSIYPPNALIVSTTEFKLSLDSAAFTNGGMTFAVFGT